MGKRRLYVPKEDVDKVVAKINLQQAKIGCFVNISVEPYKGKRHDPDSTSVVVIG